MHQILIPRNSALSGFRLNQLKEKFTLSRKEITNIEIDANYFFLINSHEKIDSERLKNVMNYYL